MLGVLIGIGCSSNSSEDKPKELNWTTFTVESNGIKLSAMLPANSKLDANDRFKAYIYRNPEPIFAIAVGIDINDQNDARYPVDDSEGTFADKLTERGKKTGETYEFVKRTKLNGITGTEALRLARKDDGKDRDLSTISRVFYTKRVAVFARVLFDGEKPPEEVVRKVFDSMKIEAVGPFRDEPSANK
jgi:hypothetical protein